MDDVFDCSDIDISPIENHPIPTAKISITEDDYIQYTISSYDLGIFDYGVVYDTDVLEMVSVELDEDMNEQGVCEGAIIVVGQVEESKHIVFAGAASSDFTWTCYNRTKLRETQQNQGFALI